MRLAQYEILDRIGKGGMGVVYRARDTQLGRIVAIKVLPPLVSSDPERRSRFLREAQAAANLNHPNIATVYQFGASEVEDGDLVTPSEGFSQPSEVLFLAMEYIEGEDLQAKIGSDELSVRQVFGWGHQVAQGLEAAHQAGVIHRDLKPNNIRLTHDGRVKILDFGLAKMRDQRWGSKEQRVSEIGFQTTEGMLLGTPPYMAPEQLKGSDVDHRSDLFALGVVLYQLLTGEPPYPADNLLEYVKAVSKTKPRPLKEWRPDLTQDQVAVVEKLLEQEPEDRFANATETAQALRAVGGTAPTTPVTLRRILPPLTSPASGRWTPRKTAALVGGLVLVLVAGLFLVFFNQPDIDTTRLKSLVNASPNPALGFYAENLSELLYDHLSRAPNLTVLGPSTAEGVGGPGWQILGSKLRPGTEIEGNLQILDAGTTLSLRILDTRNRRPLWRVEYHEENVDAFYNQPSSIAEDVRRILSIWKKNRRKIGASDLQDEALETLGDVNFPENALEATRIFSQVIQLDREFVDAYIGRSLAFSSFRDTNSLTQAEADARQALSLDPQNPNALIALGRAFHYKGLYAKAIETLLRAEKLDSSLDRIYLELAITYQRAGKNHEAVEALKRATELHPEYWDYWNQLGVVLWRKLGDVRQAKQAFENAKRLAPKNVTWPTANLVGMEIDRGQPDLAIELAREIPTEQMAPALASNLGTAHFQQGDYETAGTYYKQAIAGDPKDPIYHRNLGDALLKLNRKEAAKGSFQKAIELSQEQLEINPNQEEHRARLSLCLAQIGDCQRSETESEKLLPYAQQEVFITFPLAQAAALCSQRSKALDLLELSVSKGLSLENIDKSDELKSLSDEPRLRRLVARNP